MFDDLLDALDDLDPDEIREAYEQDDELDIFADLCDRKTPAGFVFRLLCVICDRLEQNERLNLPKGRIHVLHDSI